MRFNLRNCISLVVLHMPFFLLLLFLAALLLLHLLHAAASNSTVSHLPGFPSRLPFKLQTGVDDSELFYYFVKSQGRPRADPLLLYINGGPGCSALNGLFYQIGPLAFNETDYYGGLPSILSISYSWTKSANILFLDAPVGTGFSYSNSSSAYNVSDTISAEQASEFLRQWLSNHTEYVWNPLIVGADSYSALLVPIIVEHIFSGNEQGLKPHMNIKGYVISSPHEDRVEEINARIPYVHRMGLIPDELYQSAKESCNGSYADVEPSETGCVEDLHDIHDCIDGINADNILLPKCDASLYLNQPNKDESQARFLREMSSNFSSMLFQWPPPDDDEYGCPNFKYVLSGIWANYPSVRDALRVQECQEKIPEGKQGAEAPQPPLAPPLEGTIEEWYRCNNSLIYDSYDFDVNTSFDYHKNLTRRPIQVLVLSGDHDMRTPHTSTEKWIKQLNLTVQSKWRPWLVDGQIAGYTIKYGTHQGYGLTYATVKGAGHSPQEYSRRECYELFERWIIIILSNVIKLCV